MTIPHNLPISSSSENTELGKRQPVSPAAAHLGDEDPVFQVCSALYLINQYI
jgi:hypothetical protein